MSVQGVNALSLNDVQSNSDRMIVKEVIVNLEALTGKQSHVVMILV